MTLRLQLLVLSFIIIAFLFLLNLLLHRKIELKYTLVWLFGLFGVTVFVVFPSFLKSLALLFGIATPVFALFMLAIAFLTVVCISLTVVVSRLSERLRTLTQNIAIKEIENQKEKEQ